MLSQSENHVRIKSSEPYTHGIWTLLLCGDFFQDSKNGILNDWPQWSLTWCLLKASQETETQLRGRINTGLACAGPQIQSPAQGGGRGGGGRGGNKNMAL